MMFERSLIELGRGSEACPPSPACEVDIEHAEREWGLSAGEVVIAVVAIVAACELIGVLAG